MLDSFQFIDLTVSKNNNIHQYEYQDYGGVQPDYLITDWETLKNDQYKFSIDYPKSWERLEYNNKESNSFSLGESFSPIASSQRLHPPSFNLFIYPLENRNINTYLSDQKYRIITKENIIVGKIKGVLIERELKKTIIPIPRKKMWLVEKGKYMFEFHEGFEGKNESIWESILNSFKFLD